MNVQQVIEQISTVVGYRPTTFQKNIIEAFVQGGGNIACNAVAGAGKSSTLKMLGIAMQEQGIDPDRVKILVFGKKNAEDLKGKFDKRWHSSISTINACGFGMLKNFLGIKNIREVEVTDLKYRRIAQGQGFIKSRENPKGSLVKQRWIGSDADFLKLLNLVRQTYQKPTARTIDELSNHFQIEKVTEPGCIADAIALCLEVGERQAREKTNGKYCMDFCDQTYLPVKWKFWEQAWFTPMDRVLLDEAQDCNAVQQEFVARLLARKTGRAVVVGDPRQAIMGFSGADHQSYQTLVKKLKAIQLPLSTCFRCPREHIALVNKVFPEIPIESAPGAAEGNVRIGQEQDMFNSLREGDLILGRQTAPLIEICTKLITRGTPAVVLGRDVGRGLIQELEAIAELPGFAYGEFGDFKSRYMKFKFERFKNLDNVEELTEALSDKMEALETLYKSALTANSVKELSEYIEMLFSDEARAITLCTVHKAKGTEAERVFLVRPAKLPLTWQGQLDWQYEQEENLLYVALTRSKSELFIVLPNTTEKDFPGWLSEPAAAPEDDGSELAQPEPAAQPEDDGGDLVQSVVVLEPRATYYAAPGLKRLEVLSATKTQLRVSENREDHPNVFKSKAYLLPQGSESHALETLQGLRENLDKAMRDIKEKLASFDFYPDRLNTTGGAKKVKQPVSQWVLLTHPDDQSSFIVTPWEEGTYFLNAEKREVIKHSAKMLTYKQQTEAGEFEILCKQDDLRCVTEEEWAEYCTLREAAIAAAEAMHSYLLSMGTYSEFEHEQRLEQYPGNNVIPFPVAPAPEAEAIAPVQAEQPEAEPEPVAPTAEAIAQVEAEQPEAAAVEAIAQVQPEQPAVDDSENVSHRVWINPGLIRLDLGTQSRADGTNEKIAKRYAMLMKDGAWNWENNPPVIFYDGENYFPGEGDGHKRILAAAMLGCDILVDLRPGDLLLAQVQSARANRYNDAEKLKRKDKRHIVETLLLSPERMELLAELLGHPGANPSNGAIAEYCGSVTRQFVGKVRTDLIAQGLLEEETEVVDRQGRKIKTEKIGGSSGNEDDSDEGDNDSEEDATPSHPQVKKLCAQIGAKEVAILSLRECNQADMKYVQQQLREFLSIYKLK